MKLSDVISALEWITIGAAWACGIAWAVLLIKRAIFFSKCANEAKDFYCNAKSETTIGKVIFRRALRRSVLVKRVYETTIEFYVEGKKYTFTEASVGRAFPLNDCFDVEYDVSDPSSARIKDGTDVREFEMCIVKSVAEIALLAVALCFCPAVIYGIFGWIDFIIRFIYELAGGVPYNL